MNSKSGIIQKEGYQVDDSINSHPVKKLLCTSCSICQADNSSKLKGEIIDNILADQHPDGFRDAHGFRDLVAHNVMSQVLHVLEDIEDPNRCLFDKPDLEDRIRFLVKSGEIIGYYTVKPKGTQIEYTYETYDMNTLDTIYVTMSHRGRGQAGYMLEDLVNSYPGQDIGVSKPISANMMRVFHKFFLKRPEHRFKFWEVDGAGGEGRMKLLYMEIVKRFNK